jgi:hypothetical protein
MALSKIKRFFIVTILLIFVGLSIYLFCLYISKYKPKILQNEYKVKIPFKNYNGLIYIYPKINKKEYSFILDTGALSVISIELANELGIKYGKDISVKDSQEKSKNSVLTKISNINLGSVGFVNYDVVILDLKEQLGCLDIDGIIGSNMMKDAKWEINQEEGFIYLTDDLSKTNYKSYKNKIPFFTNNQHIPFIKINFSKNVNLDFMLDTGYTEGILLSSDNKLLKDSIKQVINVTGNSDYGVFKKQINKPKDNYYIYKTLKIGENNLKNILIYQMNNSASKLGNTIFKNNNYVIDWDTKMIYLKDKINTSNKFNTYGFNWNFINNKVLISSIYNNTIAEKTLNIGDQIINFNGEDWSNLSTSQWCDFSNIKYPDTIKVKIKDAKNAKIKEISFVRKNLIKY